MSKRRGGGMRKEEKKGKGERGGEERRGRDSGVHKNVPGGAATSRSKKGRSDSSAVSSSTPFQHLH